MPGVERALSHRGVPLGPEAMASFRDTFLRQFPWTMRSFLEVERVLGRERPDVLVLYAESSGLGRAAIAAARAKGVPSVAVQHGIMYPQYYSHEHAPDELERDPVPIPSRTAVFGELAKKLLVQRGSYPEERIVVTGSPKFDALVDDASGYDPSATRRALGVPEGSRFLVLATRWSAVSAVFEDLVRAIESLPGVFLFVKPHQAESPIPYEEVVERLSAGRTRILPPEANLLELLFASDGLITVDSFASSEALVLGRPVLVLNLPGNLGPLVDRGVALGVRRGESIAKALETLLFDSDAARSLETKRKEYIREFAFGADGRSTERIVECILNEAERGA
jgi:UDP-N-acetylglucosamine 2-epimerase